MAILAMSTLTLVSTQFFSGCAINPLGPGIVSGGTTPTSLIGTGYLQITPSTRVSGGYDVLVSSLSTGPFSYLSTFPASAFQSTSAYQIDASTFASPDIVSTNRYLDSIRNNQTTQFSYRLTVTPISGNTTNTVVINSALSRGTTINTRVTYRYVDFPGTVGVFRLQANGNGLSTIVFVPNSGNAITLASGWSTARSATGPDTNRTSGVVTFDIQPSVGTSTAYALDRYGIQETRDIAGNLISSLLYSVSVRDGGTNGGGNNGGTTPPVGSTIISRTERVTNALNNTNVTGFFNGTTLTLGGVSGSIIPGTIVSVIENGVASTTIPQGRSFTAQASASVVNDSIVVSSLNGVTSTTNPPAIPSYFRSVVLVISTTTPSTTGTVPGGTTVILNNPLPGQTTNVPIGTQYDNVTMLVTDSSDPNFFQVQFTVPGSGSILPLTLYTSKNIGNFTITNSAGQRENLGSFTQLVGIFSLRSYLGSPTQSIPGLPGTVPVANISLVRTR
jgi:hypothetical protein